MGQKSACDFYQKDENLNKAHIKYLENRLHDIAKFANRYKIDNSIIPTQSSISESDRVHGEENSCRDDDDMRNYEMQRRKSP